MGTGAGFAAAKPIVTSSNHFELSLEKVGCFPDNTTAGTAAGLYDLYGEGQPAYVELSGNAFNIHTFDAASAGLLTRIDNGYGASTSIAYRSAKEDVNSNHLVPFPETVVTAVTTQIDFGSGQSPLPTLYAYGNASQYFDSANDRWVFPGYRRQVSLRNAGDPGDPGAGNAVITDAYPLGAVSLVGGDAISLDGPSAGASADATTRLLRYLKAGRTSDVTTISGTLGTDPWALLATDITTDARRISATHTAYAASTAQLLPAGKSGNEYCVDMLDPYDYTASLNYKNSHESYDQCAERGFALPTSVASWRGTPGTAAGTANVISSPQIVQTFSSVAGFDALGRVTTRKDMGDLNDSNDDLTIQTDYAAPQTSPQHVLNAVSQQTVMSTSGAILARKRFEYDGLASGNVANGFLTSSTVTRYDGDAPYLSLGDIRLFDTTFDANGNPLTTTKTRDNDGAQSTTTFSNYDSFGLVATRVTSSAVDGSGVLAPMVTSTVPDPVTLKITSTTNANGTVTGATYDGFGRVTREKVTPPGGTEGVLSSTSYANFELFDVNGNVIPDTSRQSRSITQKVFKDAVPEANVATAPGRIDSTILDPLGRIIEKRAELGADYQNQRRNDHAYL